ncbi:MAG: SDR family NAD(P)-dependent oxidoreductase, partial [Caulobacter sp.]
MADIRFDGKVAIVTGAGGGLGRQHALELARRGAKVVINDLGGSMDGSGGSSAAAEAVVAEIKAFGGEAIANGSSVTDDAGVANMVQQAMDA